MTFQEDGNSVFCGSGYMGLHFCQISLSCMLKMITINKVRSGKKKNGCKEHRHRCLHPKIDVRL